MNTSAEMGAALCSFESCEASVIEQVVLATVDQLCAQHDVDIALLDALEYPLGEGIAALAPFGIARVGVDIDGSDLRIVVALDSEVTNLISALGDEADIVLCFFDRSRLHGTRELALVGRLY